MEMQTAAERVAREVQTLADAEQLHLFGQSPKEIASTMKLLDSYQDRFFEYWRQEIDRREGAGKE
jgi:hypothetical protein